MEQDDGEYIKMYTTVQDSTVQDRTGQYVCALRHPSISKEHIDDNDNNEYWRLFWLCVFLFTQMRNGIINKVGVFLKKIIIIKKRVKGKDKGKCLVSNKRNIR